MGKTALIIAVLAAAVVGGIFVFARSGPPRDETLVYRLKTDAPSLDPAHLRDTTASTVAQCIFDGLVEQDPLTLEVVPQLATHWEESDDKTVYTFHLRKGITFHNGREVTAEDFKYSMERVLDPATAANQRWVLEEIKGADTFKGKPGQHVEGIEVLDPYTLRITLERPFAPFLAMLSMEAASPVPREHVEKWGEDIAAHPMGCGPYRFVKWKKDAVILLERFDDYWGDKAGIKYIKFKVVFEESVALSKYLNGDFDILPEMPPNRKQDLLRDYPDEARLWPILGVYYIGFNHTKPPFKGNVKLRQAFNYAVNKKAICDVLLEGIPQPARGVLPPGFEDTFDETLEGYPYDPDKARALLEEAGYPNGDGLPAITLQFNQSEDHARVCTAIQNNLRDIGVNVRLKNLEWAAHLDSMQKHEPLLFRSGWLADVADEDNFLYVLLHTDIEANYGGYSNPEYDTLIERARHSIDPEERRELYRTANRSIVEDAAWLFVYWYRDVILIKPYVEGWTLPLQGDFRMPLHKLRFSRPPA